MSTLYSLAVRLGLSKNTAHVYESLLQQPNERAGDIARKTGMHRPAVYRALEELESKGLLGVGAANGKQKRYAAAPFSALRGMVQALDEEVLAVLPQIEKYAVSAPSVRVLKGKEGIRAVFADLVATVPRGGMFYRYTSEKDLDEVNAYLPKRYRIERDAKQLGRQVISNYRSGERKKTRLDRGLKFVPKNFDVFEQNIIELIYGTKVATIDLNSFTSIIIESAPIAEFQAKLFKLLYSRL